MQGKNKCEHFCFVLKQSYFISGGVIPSITMAEGIKPFKKIKEGMKTLIFLQRGYGYPCFFEDLHPCLEYSPHVNALYKIHMSPPK